MGIRSLSLLTSLAIVLAIVSLAGASPYSDYVIRNTDPVLNWNLDEGGGSAAYDLVPGSLVPPTEDEGTQLWLR